MGHHIWARSSIAREQLLHVALASGGGGAERKVYLGTRVGKDGKEWIAWK